MLIRATHFREDLSRIHTAALLVVTGLSALARGAVAQQAQLELDGLYSVTTSTHTKSWGGSGGVQVTFGGSNAPLALSVTPSVSYLKQENSGPGQTNLGASVNLQSGGHGAFTPYVGADAGSNWSTGSNKQWEGARLGVDMLAGTEFKFSSKLTGKAEERFGYINGQEHTLTTALGLLVSFSELACGC